ncbi:MAG: DnaJ family domain-containing protein [Thermomicrobiales bacterium]
MFNWGRIVEEQIRDAQQKGEFDDLAGQGKPLDFNEDETAFEGDLKMAHHVLKNADALPFWIELDKEIRARQEYAHALLAQLRAAASPALRRKLIADYREEAKAINDHILHFNCICPAPHILAKAPINAEANINEAMSNEQ